MQTGFSSAKLRLIRCAIGVRILWLYMVPYFTRSSIVDCCYVDFDWQLWLRSGREPLRHTRVNVNIKQSVHTLHPRLRVEIIDLLGTLDYDSTLATIDRLLIQRRSQICMKKCTRTRPPESQSGNQISVRASSINMGENLDKLSS
jgi:hypothetical protein